MRERERDNKKKEGCMCATIVVKLRCIRVFIGVSGGQMMRWCKENAGGGQRFPEMRMEAEIRLGM